MSNTAIRYLTMLRMVPRFPRSITTEMAERLDDQGFPSPCAPYTQDLRWWLTAQARHCDILEPRWLRDVIETTISQSLDRIRMSQP